MRRFALLLVPALLAACQDAPAPTAPAALETAALLRAPNAIPGEYIVVFNAGVADAPGLARQLTAAHGGTLRHTYQHAIRGFAASLPAGAVAALRQNPSVAYIEEDQPVHAILTTQTDATWGIDRVDQRDLPLSVTYSYEGNGAGVNAYILDTGIRYSHSEFGGRASFGYDAFGGDGSDCNGHGTHVAGTVGGTVYGVAKGVSLVAVRVLDCQGSGTTSGVIAGIDWVTANHVKPAVANMSLGGGASSTLDAAVENSIAAGVTYGLAAGNGDMLGRPQDACDYSPARVPAGITVGSTTSTDTESSFSNYGTCVDILAPGSSITSAWYDGDTSVKTISGTSMATPHVVGAAALYVQAYPGATPPEVSSALTTNASKDKITLHSRSTTYGTPNLLLYTAFLFDGGTPTNAAPVASFTYACTDLACDFTDTSTDSDGTISSRDWTFGDGAGSTATNPSHTYAAGGTYTVTLAVTDDAGATSSSSQDVTVSSSTAGGIALSASGYKVKGAHHVDLTWTGATSTSVDVFRDGAKIATTANDGAHTDAIGAKGGGSYVYRVCEAGTTTCSGNVTVTF